jgi:hypothetical protein
MDLLIISDWGSIEITIGHLASLAISRKKKYLELSMFFQVKAQNVLIFK